MEFIENKRDCKQKAGKILNKIKKNIQECLFNVWCCGVCNGTDDDDM